MRKGIVFQITIALFCLTSCIKDPPPDPECDIETFTVDPSLLSSDVFIDQVNRKILLYLRQDAYQHGIAPVITVSQGATITPASGDSIHFEQQVQYTVRSQDGHYSKIYQVEVVPEIDYWLFDFNYWITQPTDKYQYPVEDDGTTLWSSGNPGVALAGVPKDPSSYPTRATTDSYEGAYAAELVTRTGTSLSSLVGIRLFAGSLFLGNFNSLNALVKPLEATQFGQPFSGKALVLTGYYKYQPGPSYQDEKGNAVAGITDSCSIYAVVFKGTERLDGTNIHTSDRIIATAILPDGSARSSYTHFAIPFQYIGNADLTGDMMVTIVLSSSKDGDIYRGAIGSQLIVDHIQIVVE